MSYQSNYETWLQSSKLTEAERAELHALSGNDSEIESRFFGPLEFGTAGLRGIMGTGLNRMNIHIIRHTTQAFAEVILAEGAEAAKRGIAICFDCRHHSSEFAREAACVMAGNGIPVYLFSGMRPTPELSFAVRHYGCTAGINITASHNPKEYNGYKVYWADGAQLPPQQAAAIAENMSKLDLFEDIKAIPYETACADGRIHLLGEETDALFLGEVMALANDRELLSRVSGCFSMVYTPFHGTGYEQIPYVLKALGVTQLHCVPEQMVIDPDFSTVPSPNPENPESFALAIALAKKTGADLILGSDPDADRVGILAKNRAGEYELLSGNQTGVLLLDYLIQVKERLGTLPAKPAVLKTIVTTEMARKVAQAHSVACYDTFTGFKFMAEKKHELESSGEAQVFFSYEESFGYMLGDFTRDKDAVSASLLLTEMAAYYAEQKMTLFDALEALFVRYGYHEERTLNLVMPGLAGMANMKALMKRLRAVPPAQIARMEVLTRWDYQSGVEENLSTGESGPTHIRGSDVLKYHLAGGTDLIIRPSGTEPKIKVYILASGADRESCRAQVERCVTWANESLQ